MKLQRSEFVKNSKVSDLFYYEYAFFTYKPYHGMPSPPSPYGNAPVIG